MSIKVDLKSCVGCGNCLEMCNNNAFKTSGKYSVEFKIDECLNCDECGVLLYCLGECINYV